MGLFDNDVGLVQKVQLTHGALLTQREIKARKQLFGIECFDILAKMSQSLRMNLFMHQVDVLGAESFMTCEQDIGHLEQEKEAKVAKLRELERAGGGHWMQAEKLRTQASFIDGKIQACKEQFGITFFDAIHVSKVTKRKGYALFFCIENAKSDIGALQNRQKLREHEARMAEC